MRKLIVLIVVVFLNGSAMTQSIMLSGKVVDGQSLSVLENVHISLVGKSTGVITDSNGDFSIGVDKLPALLYFSHVGYIIDQLRVVTASNAINVKLFPERQEIEEVLVSAQRIQKVDIGDTLNVIDYEVTDDGLILLATPYKQRGNRLLLKTAYDGKRKFQIPFGKTGREVKYPEIMAPVQIHFFKDFLGEIHLLTRDTVWEVSSKDDSLTLTYPIDYSQFLEIIFPIKCRIGHSFFYQVSSETENHTFRVGSGMKEPVDIKEVYDKWGNRRYLKPGHRKFYKYVSAPVFSMDSSICVFDFFGDNIEFFSEDGVSIKTTPITFQKKRTRVFLWRYEQDLDQKNFPQKIFQDAINNRFYALYRYRVSGKQFLKEIDMDSGKIIQSISIPDFTNVRKVRIHNNTVYFLYDVKLYPYYTNLYKMKI